MITIEPGEAPELTALLAQRLYEHNAAATGYHDGESFAAARRGDDGAVAAGVSGHTWGGCCYVAQLWVSAALRGQGIGTRLLEAVEHYALGKGCRLVLLASHSFQAPGFYARRGYSKVAEIENHPVGHSDIFYSKLLRAAPSATGGIATPPMP